MTQDSNEKYLKDLIKKSIKELNDLDKKENEDEIPFKKIINIEEKDIKDFDILLKFAVHSKTGKAGLLINNNELKPWNKTLSQVLLDNIGASLLFLKEELN